MSGRRGMHPGDWLDAIFKLVIGMCLGVAVSGVVRLFAVGYWPVAVVVLFGIAALLLFEGALDRVFERLFPSGIRPAPKPKVKTPKPFVLLASLPVGIAVGVILEQLGLAYTILGVL